LISSGHERQLTGWQFRRVHDGYWLVGDRQSRPPRRAIYPHWADRQMVGS